MKAKPERNARIYNYSRKHPNTSIAAIARMFKVSRQRASKIIHEQEAQHGTTADTGF